jgi:hypothetical protein
MKRFIGGFWVDDSRDRDTDKYPRGGLPGIDMKDVLPSHPHLVKEDGGLFWPTFKWFLLAMLFVGILIGSWELWRWFIHMNCPCR